MSPPKPLDLQPRDPCPVTLQVDEQVRAYYEQTMSEWLGCEAIVRQREKEQHAAALAKCLSVSASVDNPNPVQRMMHHDSSISNEVTRARSLLSTRTHSLVAHRIPGSPICCFDQDVRSPTPQ